MLLEKHVVSDFDRASLPSHYTDSSSFVSVWSPAEVRLLARINPLIVKRMNDQTGSAYPVCDEYLGDQAKILAGFLIFTMDNSLFHGIMTVPMVETKVRNHSKMLEASGAEPELDGVRVTPENITDLCYLMKRDALAVVRDTPFSGEHSLLLPEPDPPAFIDGLAKVFGGGLEHVVQYGSSVHGAGSDIDLLLFQRGITKRTYHEMSGRHASVRSESPLGIVLLPPDGFDATAACDDHSRLVGNGDGRLLYGSALPVPVQSDRDLVAIKYLQAGKELSSLRGSLGDRARLEVMTRSEGLLRSTLKNEIWVRQSLLQYERGRPFSKSETMDVEAIPPVEVEPPMPLEGVQRLLYDANCRVKERIELHLDRIAQ